MWKINPTLRQMQTRFLQTTICKYFFRILQPRESLKIQLLCLRTKRTIIWNITKKDLFSISQGEILFSILQILFSPWQIKNTIREFLNTIRLFADIFIVFSNRIKKKTPSSYRFYRKVELRSVGKAPFSGKIRTFCKIFIQSEHLHCQEKRTKLLIEVEVT